MVSASIAHYLSAPWSVAALVTLLTVVLSGRRAWHAVLNRFARRFRFTAGDTARDRAMPATELPGARAEDNDRHLTRDEAVEALRRAEAKYRGIFENAIEGIFQTSPDGRYLSANPALARIYDYDSPEHLMASIGDIERQLYVDPQRRSEFIRVMESQGYVANFESQIFRRDGGVIWIAESARAVRDECGEIEFYEGTVEDITERKQSEALAREKEAAEAASRAKSQFLANMSHELRTPLNGVIGMLDLLMECTESPQQKRYASIARSSADLLLSVINQVLDFSKIEAGKLELDAVDFRLRTVIEETLDMLAPKAAQKKLELALDMPAELCVPMRGDPHRLQQVIVNLVGNAVKFTQQGQVQVRASLERENAEQTWVRIAVEDTGIGVPAGRRDRLFRAFSQIDPSTTRQFGGTGLGLAISKQLVELMGGEIGLESDVDRGSVFWFTVPLARIPCTEAARPTTPRELAGLRVLVVDDNATNREILFRQLSAWQIRVLTAPDGPSALAMLAQDPAGARSIDLGIIDFHMPGMDGCELARRMADDEQLRAIPLVLLTSLALPVNAGDSPTAPVAGRLTKPVRQSQLIDMIVSLTAKHHERADFPGAASVATARRPDPQNAPGRRARSRLLLAEDNEINRIVALEILTLAGFHCDVATNGREAVARQLCQPYDAILMDCQMPELDGLAAAREIRRLEDQGALGERGYRVPIIALTANAARGDRELCLAAGMDEYLSKPLDSSKLISVLDAMLVAAVTERTATATGSAVQQSVMPEEDLGISDAVAAGDQSCAPRVRDGEVDSHAPQRSGLSMIDPPLDLAELLQRCLGNQELRSRIVASFAERLPKLTEELERAVSENRLADAAIQAHGIKGSAANLSATRLKQVACDMEQSCRAGDSLFAAADMTRLRLEVDRCLDFISQAMPVESPVRL